MTERRIYALSAIFAALLVASYFAWKREQPEEARPSPLASVAVDSIARIDIAPPGGPTTSLVRRDGQWRLSSPIDDAVNPEALGLLLNTLRDFSIGSVVSDSAARQDRYEVTTASATRLTVRLNGAEKPVLDVLVGKATANYSSSFIRWPDDNKVRTGDGLSSYLLRLDVGRLRSPILVSFPFGQADRISARWKGGEAAITRSSDTWATGSHKPVPEVALNSLREGLAAFRAGGFDTLAPLGNSDGEFSITAGTATVHVTLGETPKTTGAPASRRLTVEGRPSVILVPEAAVQKILSTLKGLR